MSKDKEPEEKPKEPEPKPNKYEPVMYDSNQAWTDALAQEMCNNLNRNNKEFWDKYKKLGK